MDGYYKLDGKTPVPCDSVLDWGRWFEKADRQVAHTKSGDVTVSTVFLGLDHAYGDSTPILFETMIFGGEHNEDQWRYATWDEAVAGHAKACALVGHPAPEEGEK